MARRTKEQVQADISIKHGTEFPYNDRPPTDWAEVAALGVIADLCDRRGIKNGFYDVEEDASIRNEIVRALAEIVRRAHSAGASRDGD